MPVIKNYISRTYLDKNGASSLLTLFTNDQIVRAIMKLLKSSNEREYYEITGFARDFFLSNDLTKRKKEAFYQTLKREGFFTLLDKQLYSGSPSQKNWIVYTLGKFSHKENAPLIEAIYENQFSKSSPIQAARCLFELDWLDSKKLKAYVKGLEKLDSVVADMTLWYYFNITSSTQRKARKILEKQRTLKFVHPYARAFNEDNLTERLWNFEQFISVREMPHGDFLKIAKKYFKEFNKIRKLTKKGSFNPETLIRSALQE